MNRHPKFMLALMITVGVGVVLVALMIYLYTRPVTATKENDSGQKLHDFFTNIVVSGQAYFTKQQ